jgi:hypothetical protein
VNPQCSVLGIAKESRNIYANYKHICGLHRPAMSLTEKIFDGSVIRAFSRNGLHKELRDMPWFIFQLPYGDVRPTRTGNSTHKGTKMLRKFGDRPCKSMKRVFYPFSC